MPARPATAAPLAGGCWHGDVGRVAVPLCRCLVLNKPYYSVVSQSGEACNGRRALADAVGAPDAYAVGHLDWGREGQTC